MSDLATITSTLAKFIEQIDPTILPPPIRRGYFESVEAMTALRQLLDAASQERICTGCQRPFRLKVGVRARLQAEGKHLPVICQPCMTRPRDT